MPLCGGVLGWARRARGPGQARQNDEYQGVNGLVHTSLTTLSERPRLTGVWAMVEEISSSNVRLRGFLSRQSMARPRLLGKVPLRLLVGVWHDAGRKAGNVEWEISRYGTSNDDFGPGD